MKILKKSKFPVEVTCKNCMAKLELEENDIMYGENGCGYFICQVCNKKLFTMDVGLDESYDLTLTKDNISFPQHFCSFENGVDISSEEIRTWINNAINYFRCNPSETMYYVGSGNTFCLVHNLTDDNCYDIEISKHTYSTSIPYDYADYFAIHNKKITKGGEMCEKKF